MKTKYIILIIVIVAVGLLISPILWSRYSVKQVSAGQAQQDFWYCSMHPWIKSDKPGVCPICGMALVHGHAHQQQNEGTKPAAGTPDYVPIEISQQKQQLVGVKTLVLSKEKMLKTIRAAGEYEGEVYAQVFEDDLRFIKVGQKAIVEIPAYHQKYDVHVVSIHPSVDEATRTARVHLWFPAVNRLGDLNPNQKKFKSNMFVNVEFSVDLGEGLVVPRQAVMDTGLRKIVFVQNAKDDFEPREIETGIETDDGYEVKSGLKEGESIVISGNFLLDSESRIQASLQGGSHGS